MKFEKSRLEPLKLEIGGVQYPIQATFNAMAEFEEHFSMPYQGVLDKLLAQDLNARELQFVLFTLLKNGGVELELEDLNDADFTIDTLNVMTDALMRANKVISILSKLEEINDLATGGGDDEKKTKA